MSWTDIPGQEPVKRALAAHLAAGTVAGAYLFAGPAGAGKRLLALEFAKALNCTGRGLPTAAALPSPPRAERGAPGLVADSKPCDECVTCQQITKGIHPDVHRITPSGSSNQIKMDDIRQVLERLSLRPYSARVQVAILEQAQRLNEEAANSLLKSLEEPTAFTRFLLTTDQLAYCLPTIVSRCQVMRCLPPPRQTVQPSLLGQLADASTSQWMAMPLPESRQDVTQLLDGLVARLRDGAEAVAGDPARHADVDRWVETAFELVALRESLEQFVSPRLVAALAREKWLSLISV